MNSPADILRREMAGDKVLTFARFMEVALYCPQTGYYDRFENRIGRGGDYFTNVSVGGVFGGLLAFEFSRWLETLQCRAVRVIEAGAEDGRLSADILDWLARHRPDLFARLEWGILEPSGNRREIQRAVLHHHRVRVQWHSTWAEVPPVSGIIFSNELLDAMPVHRLAWDAAQREWVEWGVGDQHGEFKWCRIRLSGAARARAPRVGPELAAVLPDGFNTEVSPASVIWYRAAADKLAAGRMVSIDYGFQASEFLAPHRSEGTLRGYHRHHPASNLLAEPGSQDLTAHVNFSTILSEGEAAGLRTEGFFSQERFLTGIARAIEEQDRHDTFWTDALRRQFQTLIHPDHLGRSFKVLVQSR